MIFQLTTQYDRSAIQNVAQPNNNKELLEKGIFHSCILMYCINKKKRLR